MVVTTSTTSTLDGAPIMSTVAASSLGVGAEQVTATSAPMWPASTPAWPTISSVVVTTVSTTVTYTSPATLAPNPQEVKVGWIYDLPKRELIEKMKSHGLETMGTSADLRHRFSAYLKKQARSRGGETSWLGGAKSPVFIQPATTLTLPEPPKTVPQMLVTPVSDPEDFREPRGELEIMKEMMGLPPTADLKTLREAMARMVVRRSEGAPYSEASLELPRGSGHCPPSDPRVHEEPEQYVPLPERPRRPDTLGVQLGRDWAGTSERPVRPPSPDTLEVPYGAEMVWGRERPAYEARRPVDTSMPGVLRERATAGEKTQQDCSRVCNMVRKWGLKFDGKRDPVSFLERLEELMSSYSMTPEDFLRALPELLQGSALLWFRNCKDLMYSYEAFRRQFEIQFLPPGYRRNLDEEIRKRTQGENESFRDFVIAITTLIRRHGLLSEQGKLDLIYNNMRPEYKLMVRRRDFSSLAEMMERAEDYEAYLREKTIFRPPPPSSVALVPETAYVHRKKSEKQLDTAAVQSQPQGFRRRSPAARPKSPTTNSGRRGSTRPSQPYVGKPTVVSGTSSSSVRCFRCKETGHYAKGCAKPVSCYGCGKVGVTVRQCDCRAGNGKPAQSGGRLSRGSSGERPPKSGQSGSEK